jgi:hypothetical protein
VLLWLGALILAAATLAAACFVHPVRNWWSQSRPRWKALACAGFLVAVVLVANLMVAGVSAFTDELKCVVEGQVYDLEGDPLRTAAIVARPPEPGRTEIVIENFESYRLATTDTDGRFRGDCEGFELPFYVAVNFNQHPEYPTGEGERCEWWDASPRVVDEYREYQFNFEIPVELVKANRWDYNGDYRCSDSDWGPSASVPGG